MNELVTEARLQEVIEEVHASPIRIRSFRSEQAFRRGENFMTVTLRVRVVFLLEQEEKLLDLFVKVMPEGKEDRMFVTDLLAFEREACVYNELIPSMKRNVDELGLPSSLYPDVPRCFLANGSGPDPIIVLEDLQPFGYYMGDRLLGATVEETTAILKSLAKFHANGISLARKLGRTYRDGSAFRVLHVDPYESSELLQSVCRDNSAYFQLERALRALPGNEANADRLKKYIDEYCGPDQLPALFGRLTGYGTKVPGLDGYRLGDCWLNNQLLRDEVDENGEKKIASVKLVDFQMVQQGSPFPDLHYFFGSSVSAEVCSMEKFLLETVYYQELFDLMAKFDLPLKKEDYSFQQFWLDFVGMGDFRLLVATRLLPLVTADFDSVPDFDSDVDLNSDTIKRLITETVTGPRAAVVMHRFAGIIQNLIDFGIL